MNWMWLLLQNKLHASVCYHGLKLNTNIMYKFLTAFYESSYLSLLWQCSRVWAICSMKCWHDCITLRWGLFQRNIRWRFLCSTLTMFTFYNWLQMSYMPSYVCFYFRKITKKTKPVAYIDFHSAYIQLLVKQEEETVSWWIS